MRDRTLTPKEGIRAKYLPSPWVVFFLFAGFLAGCGGGRPPASPPSLDAGAGDSLFVLADLPAVLGDTLGVQGDTLAIGAGSVEEEARATELSSPKGATAEETSAPEEEEKAQEAPAVAPPLLQAETETYRIVVDDELTLTVIGYPELTGTVRVLPDGTITVPGAGTVYLLGDTVEEATAKVNGAFASILRYPKATVSVTKFGDRRVFVMGEVVGPGDHAYHRGLTAVGAIAMAGGFNNFAKRSSVIVLRRTSEGEAIAYRVDTRDILKGKHMERDLPLRPYDIVFVPRTFIGNVNVLFDQYFAQLTPPFSLYLTGWNAFHVDDTRVRFITP